MFRRMLINDLKNKKSINLITFIFMTIASILLACSVNLLSVASSGISKFMDESKISDYTLLIPHQEIIADSIKDFNSDNENIENVDIWNSISIKPKEIKLESDKENLPSMTQYFICKVQEESNLIFTEDDEKISVKDGEIYFPFTVKSQTDLSEGDKVSIKVGDKEYIYKIAGFFKDAAFGTNMVSVKRLVVSNNDFNEFYNNCESFNKMDIYNYTLNTEYDSEKFEGDFCNKTLVTPLGTFSKDTFNTALFMENGIVAAILLLVSIIAIGILIFTLSFIIKSLLYDEYKQIGIMKALGIPNHNIKILYLAKFIFLSVFAAVLGILISIPIINKVLGFFRTKMMVNNSALSVILAVIANIVLVLIITCSVYLSMRKVNKLDPLSFILKDRTLKRGCFDNVMHLSKSKILPIPSFLAVKDIIANFKSYALLAVVFILSSIIVIIPLNLSNTFNDKEFGENYAGITNGDFYVIERDIRDENGVYSTLKMNEDLEKVTEDLKTISEDITLKPELTGSIRYISDDGNIKKDITYINSAKDTDEYSYLSGKAPKEKDEIAITTVLFEEYKKGVGDKVTLELCGEKKEYKITGIFQSIFNVGQIIRLSNDNKPENVTSVVYVGNGGEVEKLKDNSFDINLVSNEEYIGTSLGSIKSMMLSITGVIMIIAIDIIFILSCLFTTMFMYKESGEIAILKSIGIKNSVIKRWQGLRILYLLIVSIIIGITIANYKGASIVEAVLASMGMAKIDFVINNVQVWIIYPLIMMAVVILGVVLGLVKINSIDIREMFE